MNSKNNLIRLLGWAILIGIGYFIGSAYTTSENQNSLQEPIAEATTNNTTSLEDDNDEGRDVTPTKGLSPNEVATIKLFEDAAPSVCFITTTTIQNDYFSRRVEVPRGTGSGFVWDRNGHIVTNFHVIQDVYRRQSGRITVTMGDQSSYQATLVGIAVDKDLAVLKIQPENGNLRPIPVGRSENLKVGQNVYAIGNPFGLDQTLTTGIVSALGREIQSLSDVPIKDAIQTDAAINPGNSGGPLLDSSGRLIGVNTAIYSPSGASAGIGFSIPVDVVNWVVPEIIKYGELRRPSIGIELATGYLAQRLGLGNLNGVLVLGVSEGSAAEKAGLQPTYRNRYGEFILGDIIVGIDNQKISSQSDLVGALANYRPGDRIKLKIIRNKTPTTIDLQLDDPLNR